jgi:hypothetical protein
MERRNAATPADDPRTRAVRAAEDLPRFAQTYVQHRGLQHDDRTVQLVHRAARKYRGPMPVAWSDLERFVERVLTPQGPGPL